MSKWRLMVLCWLVLGLCWAAICLTGCQNEDPSKVTDSSPAVGTSVDKAKTHVESADSLVVRAKPESNKTGQALLDAATDEHGAAIKELKTAKEELGKVQQERSQLVRINSDTTDALNKAKNTWGYKLGQIVNKIIWFIVAFLVFHYIAAFASLFIVGPIGAVIGIVAKWTDVFKGIGKLSVSGWLKQPATPCP